MPCHDVFAGKHKQQGTTGIACQKSKTPWLTAINFSTLRLCKFPAKPLDSVSLRTLLFRWQKQKFAKNARKFIFIDGNNIPNIFHGSDEVIKIIRLVMQEGKSKLGRKKGQLSWRHHTQKVIIPGSFSCDADAVIGANHAALLCGGKLSAENTVFGRVGGRKSGFICLFSRAGGLKDGRSFCVESYEKLSGVYSPSLH